MITINYCPEGRAYSDFEAEQVASKWINDQLEWEFENYHFDVSTENVIHAVRCFIVENRIRSDIVKFVYNGKEMYIDEFGNPDKWVDGFCDINYDRIRRIFKAQMKIRKEKNN